MTRKLATAARRSSAPVALALALVAVATGCAATGSETATSMHAPDHPPTTGTHSTSQSPAQTSRRSTGQRSTGASTPATDAAARAEAFTSPDRAVDGGAGAGNGLTVTGVRTARHPGYDRIVFDLDGAGTPGWYATYTAHPVQDGSGEPITIAGTAFLQLTLHGIGMPYDTGVTPSGDDSTRVPGTGTRGIAEIAPGAVFEGDQLAVIGLTGAKRPYRVFALTNPVRVVVDVRGD